MFVWFVSTEKINFTTSFSFYFLLFFNRTVFGCDELTALILNNILLTNWAKRGMHCFGHSVYKCNLLNDHRHYYCATCESLSRKFLDCLHLVVYRDEILTNGIQFFLLLGVPINHCIFCVRIWKLKYFKQTHSKIRRLY